MNFDLNIENYNKDELIEMFELPSNFDRNIVEIKEARLKDSIINNKEINKETQVKTLNFLMKAKNIILNDSQPSKNTTLQEKIEDFYNSSYELKTSKLEDREEHMVQVRPEKPYLSSFPSEFFPGVINPIKKRTIKKNLNIDTKFRENYYTSSASNFNFTLPINMNDVLQMQLASIELPTTYYAVSKQILNITLKPTYVWHNGLILTNKNMVISTLNTEKENKLELVNYKDITVLLLNNSIVYDNKKLFYYKLNLSLTNDDFIFNKERFNNCINYVCIKKN